MSDDFTFHPWPPTVGGQRVGVSTGMLVVHEPSGLAAICVTERSRKANQEAAMERLRTVLRCMGFPAISAPRPDPATCPHVCRTYGGTMCADCGAVLP